MPLMLRTPARWLRWLTPGLYVKRWLLLLMFSILMVDLGIAYFLKDIYAETRITGSPGVLAYYGTLQFLPRPVRAFLFGGLGVGLLVFSFYMLQRSILGPFIPGGDRSVAELLYSSRVRSRGPRIVSIGGGHGLSTLLRGLKEFTGNLHAIVTVADDGGSSGRLRDEYRILPPGDIRQCLVALADAEPLVKELFDHRFKDGTLEGHSFGNLFIMAMAEVTGDIEHAVRESGRVLAVRGEVLPSTLQDVVLCASVNGGTVVGESKIPMQEHPITRVFLRPDNVEINPEAALAILNADIVTVGPGSLYTSILPNLLVHGMVEAIKASPALKVFVCNVASEKGETDNFGVSDFLRVLEDHVGSNIFDFVIVNSNHNYTPTGGQSKVLFDMQRMTLGREGPHFILTDVVNRRIPSHHDTDKLARTIMKKVWRA
ncbi:MAG: YvcK family protein [Chloroflexi bacterium]|nr:MAG: YvcK family protein [Chloroflexota bacterium]TME16412.1 MAG: YvcK family protein [Chloroflexota bacterium]TME17601.1 MAG: YvcK family protein [Chloroflexota bacterium]